MLTKQGIWQTRAQRENGPSPPRTTDANFVIVYRYVFVFLLITRRGASGPRSISSYPVEISWDPLVR